MQITVVGDEIRVDGSTVGAIWGGPSKECEALRDALRDAPDVEYANGVGWFGEPDDDDDDEGTEIAMMRAQVAAAVAQLRKHRVSEAIRILGKALDA